MGFHSGGSVPFHPVWPWVGRPGNAPAPCRHLLECGRSSNARFRICRGTPGPGGGRKAEVQSNDRANTGAQSQINPSLSLLCITPHLDSLTTLHPAGPAIIYLVSFLPSFRTQPPVVAFLSVVKPKTNEYQTT